MARRFMRSNRGWYAVREMAGIFGVGGGAYRRRAKRGASGTRREADGEAAELVRGTQKERRGRRGVPRAREELRNKRGKRASRRKAAALMRERGLSARRRRKLIPATDSSRGLAARGDLSSRESHAGMAGEKRVSDITCPRARGGWACLTAVIGLYDRKVIGLALSGGLEAAQTATPALEMAFANRNAREGLIFHSDRGARRRAKSYRDRLKELCPRPARA
jgi:transposase InsO family protein